MFLFLDYDGTLAPIADSPGEAFMPQTIRSLLEEVSEKIPVAIVSGRSLMDLRGRVGLEGIVYAGNHGAEIWDGRIVVQQEMSGGRVVVKELVERLEKAVAHISGALVEEKGATASLHYRNVDPLRRDELLDLFTNIAGDYQGLVRITHGKKVLEVRPIHAWNKGDAVLWIMDAMGEGRLPIYIGDDTTDEDAYRAIRGRGISVSIGYNSEADYHLKSQGEVRDLLSLVLKEERIKT
ncbi:MAG: trehalose-phosphatase [Thermodesulfovibrionales bacterium]